MNQGIQVFKQLLELDKKNLISKTKFLNHALTLDPWHTSA